MKNTMSINEFESREKDLFSKINNPKTSYDEERSLWKQIEELYNDFYSGDLEKELVDVI